MLQRRRRVQAHLVGQPAPHQLEDLQRLGVAAGPAERGHELDVRPLTQRVGGCERVEVSDDPRVATADPQGEAVLGGRLLRFVGRTLMRHRNELLEAPCVELVVIEAQPVALGVGLDRDA